VILGLLAGLLGYLTWERPGSATFARAAPIARTAGRDRIDGSAVLPDSAPRPSPAGGTLEPVADPPSPPVRLLVPAIGVDTSLETLGLLPDGSLQAPSRWDRAGWYADGIRPGSTGPAVIAGHVDSTSGPGVFFRLRELTSGAEILVRRRDASSLRFIVDTVVSYPKTQFPTAAVYGPTPRPELRLITCTGDFDFRKRSYLDNLVVSAHQA